jgi:hypothetical protein
MRWTVRDSKISGGKKLFSTHPYRPSLEPTLSPIQKILVLFLWE